MPDTEVNQGPQSSFVFLIIHAAEHKGLCQGINIQLVQRLGEGQRYVPVTYVGGAKAASDLDLVTLVYPRGRST
ncbi:hypothetical protein PCANC_18428 [Puccinia coronata f. sp. avenae]|uniref:Uncharacterized protein n=1 Tax=Puccinia coronata f. sp. avenae TaxID=200324 RepID=A0A2N5UG01_9BASI|nr:hypothetical protein PCANC_18428 [Puccinia coronata f. sp. avenae]PLW36675.1 hypothetical protein PCASD_14134 [Puccinia coronata f. sp. avenae]